MEQVATEPKKQRYPRYRRNGEAPALDLDHPSAHYRDILAALYTFRYLTTEHLKAHLESPGKAAYQPLNRLYHAGLVERRYLFDRPVGIGSPQTVHTLTVEGARALFGHRYTLGVGSLVRKRLERSWGTLRHHLALSEFHLLVYLGLRASGAGRLTRFAADREDPATQLRLRLPAEVSGGRLVAKWPDAFLTIATEGGPVHYLVEIDLDADDRPRKRSRVAERFVIYERAMRAGVQGVRRGERVRLEDRLGLDGGEGQGAPRVQVLFVVPSARRRDELLDILRTMELRRPNFWFLAAADYLDGDFVGAGTRLVTDPVLRGLNGQPAYFLPRT